jgi:hypothetical protein
VSKNDLEPSGVSTNLSANRNCLKLPNLLDHSILAKATVLSSAFASWRESNLVYWATMGTSDSMMLA